MIHQLTLKKLVQSPNIVSLEHDFALADSLSEVPCINSSFRTDFLMIFFCFKGQMQLVVGDCLYHVKAGDSFLCKPCETINQVLISGDCITWTLFYSPNIANHVLPVKNDLAQMLERGFSRSVHFGEKYMSESILLLLDMLRSRILDRNLPFYSQTIFHFFSVVLFEVINHCCPVQNDTFTSSPETDFGNEHSKRSDSLFKQFIQLLNEDAGRHRTVAYYADSLCISPKHLSRIVKDKTGKKALDVIVSYAVQQIKIDLKLTDLPISALAAKYNFSNFSFFCQFIKKHLGLKPQEYREK